MAPLWEWRCLKEVEDKVRRGEPINTEETIDGSYRLIVDAKELCRDVARLEIQQQLEPLSEHAADLHAMLADIESRFLVP